jgi:hypothetical protein
MTASVFVVPAHRSAEKLDSEFLETEAGGVGGFAPHRLKNGKKL